MEFLLYLLLGACAGVLAGLFGVGGGIIIVPVLVFSFTLQGFDPQVLTHLAVGTSLATIIFTSINAVREHHRRGAVRWPIFVWMTVGILIGAGFGADTRTDQDANGHPDKDRPLHRAFALVLTHGVDRCEDDGRQRGADGQVGQHRGLEALQGEAEHQHRHDDDPAAHAE